MHESQPDMPDPSILKQEISSVGWDKVLEISPDLKLLTLQMIDSAQRHHTVQVHLTSDWKGFKFTATLPIPIPTLHRSNMIGFRLKAAYQEYQQKMEKFVDFWYLFPLPQNNQANIFKESHG